MLGDALDHVPVELELADHDGGKVNPTGAQLIERHRLRARPAVAAQASAVVGFQSAPSTSFLAPFSRVHADVVGAGLVVASMGAMNRDSLRRLATAEHQAAARRAGNVTGGSAAPLRPVLGWQEATFYVLRSPARRPEHVIAAVDQSFGAIDGAFIEPSRHRAAWTSRRGRGRGRCQRELHRRRSPSVRATLPRQLNGFLLDCFLLARDGPLGHIGGPDGRASEQAVTGLLSVRAASSAARRDHRPVRRRFPLRTAETGLEAPVRIPRQSSDSSTARSASAMSAADPLADSVSVVQIFAARPPRGCESRVPRAERGALA